MSSATIRETSCADKLTIEISGVWEISAGGGAGATTKKPSPEDITGSLGSVKSVGFASDGLASWDSSLLTFLIKITDFCKQANITVETEGLPDGVRRLLKLSSAVPERTGTARNAERLSFLANIGTTSAAAASSTIEIVTFTGEAFIALANLFRGKARFRTRDFFLTIEDVGIRALPIVTLISLLVGLIFAFIGSIQLKMFGAEIFVANLVGIAMVRAMGAIMTGIIMAGRTGAAFAAELGTMQVNEEIDALSTMGVSHMEFLVLPRMLALALMMPLLCLYANIMGIIGGMIVGVGMLGLNPVEYYHQTLASIGLHDLSIGIFMSAVFGVLIAMAGCLRGIQCKRSAEAVGGAATSAVVTGIVSIIIATAIITIVVSALGI